jgi:hypothetical protein
LLRVDSVCSAASFRLTGIIFPAADALPDLPVGAADRIRTSRNPTSHNILVLEFRGSDCVFFCWLFLGFYSVLEIHLGSMQPVRFFFEVLRTSLIERSLPLSNSWKQFSFDPEKMVGVVNSGIERLSGIVIHATHVFL